MALQLNPSFLPGSLASGLSSDVRFCSCSNCGVRWGQSSACSCGCTTAKASCHSSEKQEGRAALWDCTGTRRQLLRLAQQLVAAAAAAVIIPDFSSFAPQRTAFTSLELELWARQTTSQTRPATPRLLEIKSAIITSNARFLGDDATLRRMLERAAAEQVKKITNIDDARIAGEKLREIKEAADGPVLVSSSGIKELERGVGDPINPGDYVSVYYTISRLNGYYLDSMGYGKEGKNDVGETLNFQYGKGMVPEAVEGGMEGMQVGAKRRILITPERGWVRPDLLPQPTSFFAERRLSERRTTQALLIEVELVKAKPKPIIE